MGQLIKRIRILLEPEPKMCCNGLVNIGIDETYLEVQPVCKPSVPPIPSTFRPKMADHVAIQR